MIYIKRFVALFSLLLVGGILFAITTYCYRGELSHTRSNVAGYYAEEEDTIDVVILGTSTTFSSFMPMEAWNEYGITSYNFCTNVLMENSMKYYVREITKTQDVKVLVIDIAPFLFGHNSELYIDNESPAQIRRNTDAFPMSINRINLINALIPMGKGRMEYYFDLAFYKTAEPDYKYWTNSARSVTKGYHNLPIAYTYSASEQKYSDDFPAKELPANETAYLQELLTELQSFEGEVLFISQPIFYDESMFSKLEREQYIQKMVEDEGYAYLDMAEYSADMELDSVFDYSLDQMHFNSISAQKITRFLSEYIIENYSIPDKRNDAEYSSWHEDYCEWEVKLAEEEKLTNDQREEIITGKAEINEYLALLQSSYYDVEIFIPSDSPIWDAEESVECLSALNADVLKAANRACYFTKDSLIMDETEAFASLDNSIVSSSDITIKLYNQIGELVDAVYWCYDETENAFFPARVPQDIEKE